MAIGDGMTLCQYVVICLAIQISVLVTRPGCLAIHFIPAPSPCQKKLTWKMSYNHKTLITFHHDAPSSHVPTVNLLEFLLNPLKVTKHSESAKHACKSHIASEENSFHLLLSNTSYGYWWQVNINMIRIWKCIILKLFKKFVK